MFPRKIANDATRTINSHQAVYFRTPLDEKTVVATLKKGIAAFLEYDNPNNYNAYINSYGGSRPALYNDTRITGVPVYQHAAQCCAFTKDNTYWYLFPIHVRQLEAVGLTEDSLTTWLRKINLSKCGVKYYYFGRQEGTNHTRDNFRRNCHADSNEFFWVGIAPSPTGTINVPYASWIMLRYLINTTSANGTNYMNGVSIFGDKRRLSYYNIPRITMLLNEDYGVPFWKAFMYAHAANPFYSYYGLFFSDSQNTSGAALDLSLKASEFKDGIWKCRSSMNALFSNLSGNAWREVGRSYQSLQDYKLLIQLAEAGNWPDFLAHIKERYGLKKKTTIRKKKTNVKKVAGK